jgi:hypothetical protein
LVVLSFVVVSSDSDAVLSGATSRRLMLEGLSTPLALGLAITLTPLDPRGRRLFKLGTSLP